MNRTDKTNAIVMTAMMMCLILVTTYLLKVPMPFQGYVHLGDAMIFLAVLIVGKKNGAIAAAFGSALADLLGGFAAYVPWTFAVKGLMALVMGWCIEGMMKKKDHLKVAGVPVMELLGMVLGGLIMVAGYGVADAVMLGNPAAGLVGVPANCGQFIAGIVIATILTNALKRTPARKYFAYRIDQIE